MSKETSPWKRQETSLSCRSTSAPRPNGDLTHGCLLPLKRAPMPHFLPVCRHNQRPSMLLTSRLRLSGMSAFGT